MCDKGRWIPREMYQECIWRKVMELNKPGEVEKGWGHEEIIHSTESFCVKKLHFNNVGNKMSFHYHKTKYEEWTVVSGSFMLITADADRNSKHEYIVEGGYSKVERKQININDMVFIKPYHIHQLVALEDNSVIFEVSTGDYKEDNHRVAPGDSQNQK